MVSHTWNNYGLRDLVLQVYKIRRLADAVTNILLYFPFYTRRFLLLGQSTTSQTDGNLGSMGER